MWPNPSMNQPLLRPHFSPRQLVTAADLNAGVEYLVERARRHNRFLHGCGIACGLDVDVSHVYDPDLFELELTFNIAEGVAISPRGDMILVDATQETFSQVLIVDDEEARLADLGALVLPGMAEPLLVHLLMRHARTIHPDYEQPTFPDGCRYPNIGVSPTRLVEGYEFALATALPPGCDRPSPRLCGEDNALLNPRSPEHEEALMRLMRCPAGDEDDEWLVVASVSLQVGTALQLITTLHYRERSLLPSAQALLALLGCYPELPRIDGVTVTRAFWWIFGVLYVVRVTGFGLTPLAGVEVEGIDPSRVLVDLSQANHREIVFQVLSLNIGGSSTHRFRVETEFDVIDSADCGVSLDLSPNLPPEPGGLTPDGPIGGGNL